MLEMFPCEKKPNSAKVTKINCIARQKILHNGANKNGWGRTQYLDCQKCEGCISGLELYQGLLKEKNE